MVVAAVVGRVVGLGGGLGGLGGLGGWIIGIQASETMASNAKVKTPDKHMMATCGQWQHLMGTEDLVTGNTGSHA